mmetsp:Transcript_64469/g.135274  ORF Transcript_64469/g.135274 Transcript_64469/m.135274 type:complete len:389 (-) Transcript_64469:604-1770(-)|eukprot:CAMPEP_0206455602 /NCGR_PEP_ID=MMETSP0324_2-20121206/21855_1 /ASSEMBLY_ACC=CAM_ASM_000836 /TAXON_ID=2866 /ORGANISM="Crypthecodinium cohnii, Strain Seligo" /LENGTH=388 /DNA_ID=CAMNT_0053926347 /DNA_START=70 /DNA_END=1236 /DNA_ORIENTATION=+
MIRRGSATAAAVAALSAATAFAPAVLLQGCGDKPTTTSTTTTTPGSTTTSTTVTTTSTTVHARTPAIDANTMADLLNKQYLGFDSTDDTSALGVTISMVAQDNSFYKNIFCSSFYNPVLKSHTSCYVGQADCRMSASLYNHQMIVSQDGHPVLGLGRKVGIVFNQSMTEELFGKCSYIWDGTSSRRYNNGCGTGAPSDDCNSGDTAYKNICPSTGQTCTAADREVKEVFCTQFGGDTPIPPTHENNPECAFPGAAIDFHEQSDWTPSSTHLRDMVKARVARNDGHDSEGPNIEKWNEVVIDERLLLPKIWYDPAVAIPAFVYVKSDDPQFRRAAEAMRDEFCSVNLLDSKIPVIAMDSTIDVTQGVGPFVVEQEEDKDKEKVISELVV